MQFTLFTVELNPWNPLVCLHHTLAVRNFIEVWRVLTWQHCQNQITASVFYKLYDSTYLFSFLGYIIIYFFQSVFWSSLSFFLTLLFAKYSPFYMSFFMSSFGFLSLFSCPFFSFRFSFFHVFPTRAHLLLLLSISYLFSLKSFYYKLKWNWFPLVDKVYTTRVVACKYVD